jgi:hypothetical protein
VCAFARGKKLEEMYSRSTWEKNLKGSKSDEMLIQRRLEEGAERKRECDNRCSVFDATKAM